MPGNTCYYITCLKRQINYPHLKMFKFPTDDRLEKWIINSGNTKLLYQDRGKLKNKHICEEHFSKSAFKTINRLKADAIPIPYVAGDHAGTIASPNNPLKVLTPKKTYSKSSRECNRGDIQFSDASNGDENVFLDEITNMPSPSSRQLKRKLSSASGESPGRKKLKISLQTYKNHFKNHKRKICRLHKKVESLQEKSKIQNIFASFTFSSMNSKILAKMQFRKKKSAWTVSEKKLSLAFFYKSATAYKFLRRQGVILPAPSTIRKWLGKSKFRPGFNKLFFKQISQKFASASEEEKTCSVSFDEMAIMEKLEYNKYMDLVEGFEDFGQLPPNFGQASRTKNTAKYALVFLARGIYSPWKVPVAYFLSHSGANKTVLSKLVPEVMRRLAAAGLNPKISVCDQGTSNQGAYKILNATANSPYFNVEKEEGNEIVRTKVFAIYDFMHIAKSIRNNMLTGNFELRGVNGESNKIISFNDIRNAYEIDKKNTKCRALPKLTDAHLNPSSFQKMNVKLAMQVLSHSVAATIRSCVDTSEITSTTAKNTAEFIELMDKLFDCLNSRRLYDKNPYKSALSDENNLGMAILEEGKKYLSRLHKIDDKSKKTSRPPCFDGLIQAIEGTLFFYREEKLKGMKFVLTNRLNQDALENLFSIYRQKGGYNRNPTARTFRTLFRNNAINSLMKPSSSSNCEADEDVVLDFDPEEISIPVEDDIENSDDVSKVGNNVDNGGDLLVTSDDPGQFTNQSLENCAVTYFAGYLAKKCLDKFNCDACASFMIQSSFLQDKHQMLLLHRTYSNISEMDSGRGLKAPTTKFSQLVSYSLEIFEKVSESLYFDENVKSKITKIIETSTNELCKSFTGNCAEHKLFILNLLITCKLFHKFKSLVQQNKQSKATSKPKMNLKLRVLEHK